MKQAIIAVALLTLVGMASAQTSTQALIKEPVHGGFWINSKTGQIMYKISNTTDVSKPMPMAFMLQPAQTTLVSDLKSAGLEYKDNGYGYAVVKF